MKNRAKNILLGISVALNVLLLGGVVILSLHLAGIENTESNDSQATLRHLAEVEEEFRRSLSTPMEWPEYAAPGTGIRASLVTSCRVAQGQLLGELRYQLKLEVPVRIGRILTGSVSDLPDITDPSYDARYREYLEQMPMRIGTVAPFSAVILDENGFEVKKIDVPLEALNPSGSTETHRIFQGTGVAEERCGSEVSNFADWRLKVAPGLLGGQ